MGKRYYCDYCDRSFKDASLARKKHLQSVQHIKNKDEHYSYFKDPEKILEEESRKNPCNRFMTTGECQFGTVCRYSHYSPEMIQQLKNIVKAKQVAKYKNRNPDPEKIMKEFFEDTAEPEVITEGDFNLWPIPPEIEGRPDLPPSLWPMTYKDFESSDFPDWGWK